MQLGLKGRLKVAILHGGIVQQETGWQPNLILDQGMDRMSEVAICNLFAVCVKGTGTTPTKETPATSNTYIIGGGTTVLGRSAGARDFTVADLGKVIIFSGVPLSPLKITAINAVNQVEISGTIATQTDNVISLFSVEQVELDDEVGRTSSYSQEPGDNDTVTAAAVRTFTRTFIFDSEDSQTITVSDVNQYSQTTTTVTRAAGGDRPFVAGDVGSTIVFRNTLNTAVITAFTDVDNVTVDVSQSVALQPIKLMPPGYGRMETPIAANTYSRTGTTVTRTAGTRTFVSPDDIGKVIHFVTANTEATITAWIDADNVTVDVSGAVAAQNIRIYGFADYSEIGFSDLEAPGDNLNIRVLLASAVRAHIGTTLTAADQVKATYEMSLTVSPATTVVVNNATMSAKISDPSSLMSGNKSGEEVIETYATSIVLANGETDIGQPDLEPFYEGNAALSKDTTQLSPFGGTVRQNSVASVPLVSQGYTAGTFQELFTATFGLNDAIADNWRSMMIYDTETGQAIFTYRFNNNQKKSGTRTFSITFKKAWQRILAY